MIQPMGARVLVQRIAAAKQKSSILYIPDTVDEKPSQFALVIAIGSHVREAIRPGDMVVLKDFTGSPVFIKLSGDEGDLTECAIVPEDAILGVIQGLEL